MEMNIYEQIPCRRLQIDLLTSLFGEADLCVAPCLFIYGHSATGKSTVVKSVLSSLQCRYVTLNCVECLAPRMMYEHIISQLSNQCPSPTTEYTSSVKCENMNEFIHMLRNTIEDECLSDQTVYIILEQAERLRDMDMNVLPALLRLQELSKSNVCVILESDIVWEKYRCNTGCPEPYIIHFPDYSKDELIEIIALGQPDEYSESLFRNYLGLVLSIFHVACRDLNELKHLAMLNFPKYVEPITKGEATPDDIKKLWRNIEGHLKKALETVYLREVSSAQWERMQQETAENSDMPPLQGLSARINMELPFYSKYLLIAAYLASYNPAKSDKRFFAKHAGKINKKAQLSIHKKHERTTNQLLGPKPFALDRLMAIFYSIVEGRVAPTANIFTQITSLSTLGLIALVASSDHLDSPKYKCLVSLDFIKGISRSVNFEVVRYLFDLIS